MGRSARVSRRDFLAASVGLSCGAFGAPRASAAVSSATALVAAGVHVRRGVDEDATVANRNALANTAFIVGGTAALVFDPGGSLDDGRALRTAIRRVTPLPIRYVVFSHVHPDHVFGAAAFLPDEPEFIGHARLPAALAERGDYYRTNLQALLGSASSGAVVVPTRLIQAREQIDLGGRVVTLTAHGVAHSNCDLSLFDEATRTLLAGDLLFVERVPAFDGQIKGWQQELANLKRAAALRVVPGHGPVSVDWPRGSADLERYLDVVLRETRIAFKNGLDIADAVGTVGQSERGQWKLFAAYHGHNVTQAFKEVEWE